MTKKQFNSLCSLHKQGASREVIISLAIDFCKKKNTNPGLWIEKFYEVEVIAKYKAPIIAAQLKGTKVG